ARRRDGIGYRGERVRRRVRLRLEGVRELDDKRVDEHERKEGQYAVPEDLGGDALGTTTVATCRPPDAGRRVAATGDRIPRLCHEDAHRAPPEGTARRKARAMRERDRGSSRSRITQRCSRVSTTMMANRMNEIAAPDPYSNSRNAVR